MCRHQLLARPLYVFPCRHRFHQDCLTDQVTPHLTPQQRDRVAELQVRRPGSNLGQGNFCLFCGGGSTIRITLDYPPPGGDSRGCVSTVSDWKVEEAFVILYILVSTTTVEL